MLESGKILGTSLNLTIFRARLASARVKKERNLAELHYLHPPPSSEMLQELLQTLWMVLHSKEVSELRWLLLGPGVERPLPISEV